MTIQIVNQSDLPLPAYESAASAGMDLRAQLDSPIVLEPLERGIVKTGLFIELPVGVEAQVRPRSGLAIKKGVTVINAPGTIDADYRGDVGVLLINHGKQPFVIEDGMRIAQLVIAQYTQFDWNEVTDLNETDRGAGGFGSTGKQ